jgi:hypothetical protein
MSLVGFLLLAAAISVTPLGGSTLATPVEEQQRTTIHVAITQGLLTVDLRNAPLADVLQVIAEKASFRLTLRDNLSTPVTWSFTGVPLDKGIKQLVGDNSLVMIHAPANGGNALSEVRVRASRRGIAETKPNPAPDPPVYQDGERLADTAELRAARQLARQRDEVAADALVTLLAQAEDPVIRRIAAGGLGEIGDERATMALRMALVDKDRSVQRRAIFELGKIGSDDAVDALGEVLGHDLDASIRRFAAHTLARLDNMAARSALEAALADPEYMVREAAAEALAEWQSSFDHSD